MSEDQKSPKDESKGARYSPELWAVIRELWEGSPSMSFGHAAKLGGERLGTDYPSKGAVTAYAKRNGWERGGKKTEPIIAEKAAPAARAKKQPDPAAAEKRYPGGRKVPHNEKAETNATVTQAQAEAIATADELFAKLSDKQRLFALEYLHDMNATAAYMRVSKTTNAGTAATEGYRCLRIPHVKRFIEAKIQERAERTEADADMVLRLWRDAALADPNEICEFRRVACRYCYGLNHRYQSTPAEMEEDRRLHEDRRKRTLLDTENKLDIGEFDERGGLGYNALLDPNPDCPECFGEGKGEAYFHDTRKLSAAARALYGGVKIGREGLEVKVHSAQYAQDSIARHNQMFVEKVDVNLTAHDPAELERRFGSAMEKAKKRMDEVRQERGTPEE